MSAEPVVDLGIEKLLRIDARIDAHEGEAIRDRWEFGREMVAARDGKGRLPDRYLRDLCERTGKSRSELKYRMQLFDSYPTESQLATAVASYRSWTELRDNGLARDESELADEEPPPIPDGAYRTIVIDPPWQYENVVTRGAAENHYGTMSLQELEDLEIPAADDAHLYLWVTNSFLSAGFDLLVTWGFAYKTCITWCKPSIGTGNYFRNSTEHTLFAVKGTLATGRRDVGTWFEAPRHRHSAKPDRFYDLVESCSPGPYCDMFARRRRLGWTTWGNEA